MVAPVIIALAWSSAAGQQEAGPAATPAAAPGAVVAPAAAGAAGSAGVALPSDIPVLGGSKALMPVTINSRMFCGSILVGLIAGLITGVIGAGGGYILTPALMSFGVRGIMSVGTDQFHLFAKAIMGTAIHRKLGNVNFRLAAWFMAGSFVGVTAGGSISRAVFQKSPALSDAIISLAYVFVLGILSAYAIGDWWRLRRRGDGRAISTTTSFAMWLQRLPLKPRVGFDEQAAPPGRSIAVYPVILCGATVGFVASIMGVGGGFLTFPMFVYGMGVSTFTTVGTDVLQIIFTTAYSSIFQYALYGFVIYTIAMGMLVGSLIGVQIGAMATKTIKGSQIRAFYATTILAGFINRFCALPRKLADLGYLSLPRQASVWIEGAGVVLFFAAVGVFALWILAVFLRNLPLLRTDRAGNLLAPASRIIIDRAKFNLGLVGLAVFGVVLTSALVPWRRNGNLLNRADTFFSRLAKQSVYYVPQARRRTTEIQDARMDFGVRPRDQADLAHIRAIASAGGSRTSLTPDGRVRIQGVLGPLSMTALDDADLMFAGKGEQIQAKYGLRATAVIYHWWLIFDSLARRYVQENLSQHAEYCKYVSAKVLEPAYNFRDVPAGRPDGGTTMLLFLLVLYVVYTVWYGMAIMLMFEGLGITATAAKGRKEH
jgi:uncharacterized membrane protein YfcA